MTAFFLIYASLTVNHNLARLSCKFKETEFIQ